MRFIILLVEYIIVYLQLIQFIPSGFSFPADNKSVIPENLSWAPEADERERIDFVYYYPNKNLQIKSAQIVGPTGSIVRGQRIEEQTKDPIIPPVNNQWPSDHKGVLITFYIKE